MSALVVFVGGGIGALIRFFASQLIFSLSEKLWLGTFCVNFIGCLLFCLFSKFYLGSDEKLIAFVQVGILGALTTFSTFNYELLLLIKSGAFLSALGVALLNILSGILIGAWILR